MHCGFGPTVLNLIFKKGASPRIDPENASQGALTTTRNPENDSQGDLTTKDAANRIPFLVLFFFFFFFGRLTASGSVTSIIYYLVRRIALH